jgi:hypothetical protein
MDLKALFTFIPPIVVVLFNVVCYILFKLFCSKNFIDIVIQTTLTTFFSCQKAIVPESLKHDDSINGNEVSKNSSKSHKILYLNQTCDNLEMTLDSFPFSKWFIFIYFNVFLTMMGQFFIYTVFVKEVLSDTCLQGYECEKILNVTCEMAQNETKNVKRNFLCTRYGVESFDSLVQDAVIAYGVYLLSINVNNYLFKFSRRFFKLARGYLTRGGSTSWRETSCLDKTKVIMVIPVCGMLVPIIFFMPFAALILWLMVPTDIIQRDFTFALTRTEESKILSIVVTSFFSLAAGFYISENSADQILLSVYVDLAKN